MMPRLHSYTYITFIHSVRQLRRAMILVIVIEAVLVVVAVAVAVVV